MTATKPQLLLVSVGGSAQPIIHSLNQQKPEYIVYFVSPESRVKVRAEIEPQLTFSPRDHQLIRTPDEDDLQLSVKALLTSLPELLHDWNLDESVVRGDYTGGTKTMSSAVVLVLSLKKCSYSYVGGVQRDKAGLGVVMNGHEKMLYQKNPWDILAVNTLRDVRRLFNQCRFRMVQEIAAREKQAVSTTKPFFSGLETIADGYYHWDSFQYQKAAALLKQGVGIIAPFIYGSGSEGLKRFLTQIEQSQQRLERILKDSLLFKANLSKADQKALQSGAEGHDLIVDLLANARRRAELEFKYDDAVARLYSVIEKIGKLRLQTIYGIDNSNVDCEKLPDRMDTEALFSDTRNAEGKIQLPLTKTYLLLERLNDPLGERFRRCRADLDKVLDIRNSSLLAHGFAPVAEKTYSKLKEIALHFADYQAESLPGFPEIHDDVEFLQ